MQNSWKKNRIKNTHCITKIDTSSIKKNFSKIKIYITVQKTLLIQ